TPRHERAGRYPEAAEAPSLRERGDRQHGRDREPKRQRQRGNSPTSPAGFCRRKDRSSGSAIQAGSAERPEPVVREVVRAPRPLPRLDCRPDERPLGLEKHVVADAVVLDHDPEAVEVEADRTLSRPEVAALLAVVSRADWCDQIEPVTGARPTR